MPRPLPINVNDCDPKIQVATKAAQRVKGRRKLLKP
jgi:hypothetical protein